jgi:F0F1-type ATP synthase membrane subunit c/vacuolar-type H+-ATPase subunit K
MSASVWIINLVVLAAVLEADLGHRKITRFRLTRPLVIAAVIAAFWIKGVAWSGTGLWVEAAGIGAGIVLGLAAAALMRVYASDEGRPYSYAWIPYALLWVAVVGARLWFAYASDHDIRVPLGTWMFAHQLTSSALIDAFIFLALAMVLTRTGSLAVRSRALRGAPAAKPAADGQPSPASPAAGEQRAA